MGTIVDQGQIDALLAAAREEAAAEAVALASGDASGRPKPVEPMRLGEGVPPQVARLLRIRVPLIVLLARRTLPVAQIRKLSAGTILEFERDVDRPCDLLVNNRPIGLGEVVRVGENFGLRVSEIRDPAERIRSLGR